jgi:hypothetical protein
MIEQERMHKFRKQNGETPSFKAYHEVHITKIPGSLKKEDVTEFVSKNITVFKGHLEEKAGIPTMLFERNQDAQAFINELSAKLKIHREHMEIKAQK